MSALAALGMMSKCQCELFLQVETIYSSLVWLVNCSSVSVSNLRSYGSTDNKTPETSSLASALGPLQLGELATIISIH